MGGEVAVMPSNKFTFDFPSLDEFMRATRSLDKSLRKLVCGLDADEIVFIEFEVKTDKIETNARDRTLISYVESLEVAQNALQDNARPITQFNGKSGCEQTNDDYITGLIEKKSVVNIFPP